MIVRKLDNDTDLIRFKKLIGRTDLPSAYFLSGVCYGFFSGSSLLAGYCLVQAPLDEMFSITQIPSRKQFGDEDPFNFVEFVGCFINTKKYAFRFKCHLVMTLLFHKAAYFVYSYPSDDTYKEAFYRRGSPLRLYSGIPKDGTDPINVEILSRLGIIKICASQVVKAVVKWWNRTDR
jgi:hypothetical protein